MFGYVTVNRPEMKVKELELYRSYYCALCHALHKRYGRRGQILLSYDCTFLSILLTGVYEPREQERLGRCIVHPAIVHRETSNRFTNYAADMNVLLGYLKARDDWRDEKRVKGRMRCALLQKDYLRIREHYPRQERAVRENIASLHRMEEEEGFDFAGRAHRSASGRASSGSEKSAAVIMERIDRAAGYTGNFLGELCVVRPDHWEKDLRQLGFYLGKFIYLIDAYDDLAKDKESGNFNVLLDLKRLDEEAFDDRVRSILLDMAARCCRAFEHLPIIRDVELLRNILYSGIWVRFRRIRDGESGNKPAAGGKCLMHDPAFH